MHHGHFAILTCCRLAFQESLKNVKSTAFLSLWLVWCVHQEVKTGKQMRTRCEKNVLIILEEWDQHFNPHKLNICLLVHLLVCLIVLLLHNHIPWKTTNNLKLFLITGANQQVLCESNIMPFYEVYLILQSPTITALQVPFVHSLFMNVKWKKSRQLCFK